MPAIGGMGKELKKRYHHDQIIFANMINAQMFHPILVVHGDKPRILRNNQARVRKRRWEWESFEEVHMVMFVKGKTSSGIDRGKSAFIHHEPRLSRLPGALAEWEADELGHGSWGRSEEEWSGKTGQSYRLTVARRITRSSHLTVTARERGENIASS